MPNDSQHFVFCAAVPYGHTLSGRTRLLAETLALRGCRVTYVELPGLRGVVKGTSAEIPGLRVERLVSWPGFRRLTRHLPRGLWLTPAQRRMRQIASDDSHTVLVVSAPFWQPVLERHTRATICYDYLDALEVHAHGTDLGHLQELDDRLLRRADLVTPVSAPLAEALNERYPALPIRVIANGVPDAWLSQSSAPLSRSELGLDSTRPVIGFLGALYEWIDRELLAQVARALPEAQLVLVGPTRSGVSFDQLRAEPNIRFFPAQQFGDVPRWMQTFDVCLAPFKRDLVSHMADPLKIYEYLALGKPVVSTHAFGPPKDLPPILVGPTSREFIACIRQALSQGIQQKSQYRSYASRHTWGARTEELLAALQPMVRRAA